MAQPAQEIKIDGRKKTKDFVIVKIGQKIDKNDLDLVPVNVNGDRRVFMRGKWLVMPKMHLEALRNATRPMAKPMEESDINPYTEYAAKEVVDAPRFAFDVRGYISESAYQRLRMIGLSKEKGGEARSLTEHEIEEALAE